MSKNIRDLKNKISANGTAILVVLVILALAFGASWIITCGIIKLVTLCFCWTFKWSIATGIWLIMCLLSFTFKSSSSK